MSETEKLIRDVAASTGPFVVGLGRGARAGSGVVVGDGQVATLARNLRGQEVVVVFADGREAPGTLLGKDPEVDLAVIAVDTGDRNEELPWATADPADPGSPGIGTTVLALANPAGRGLRVTAGHVSAAGRGFRGPRGRVIEGVIEHTAPLPRGSGGGPLVDAEGRLLGLNAVRLDGGLILALPTAVVKERIERIVAGQPQQRRHLGVAIVPPRAARRLRRAVGLPERDGLLVRGVAQESPAARAGLERGDLIVSAGEKPVAGVDDLYAALDDAPGPTLVVGIVRGAEERELTVSFADGAADAERQE